MSILILPEVIIKQILENILLYIRLDYLNNGDSSHLHKLVSGLKIGKFDIYQQAVEIFVNRWTNHPKQLQVHQFFNLERAGIPTIHILLPEDLPGANGIGVDSGFNPSEYNSSSKTFNEFYNRTFDTKIHLVITSENSFEVILIYRILQSLLISTFNDLQFNGIQNPKISGGDLQISQDLVPQHIFFRGINIDFFYDVPALTLFTQETYSDLIAQGTAISSEDIDESSY